MSGDLGEVLEGADFDWTLSSDAMRWRPPECSAGPEEPAGWMLVLTGVAGRAAGVAESTIRDWARRRLLQRRG